EVAELVRHHVEVERVRRDRSVVPVKSPHLHETVAGRGVVDCGHDDDLELAVVASEMPFYALAEIALPDVKHEPNRAEDVRLLEFGRILRNAVEMALVVGADGAMDQPTKRRQCKARGAEGPWIDAIGEALVDREDEAHPIV